MHARNENPWQGLLAMAGPPILRLQASPPAAAERFARAGAAAIPTEHIRREMQGGASVGTPPTRAEAATFTRDVNVSNKRKASDAAAAEARQTYATYKEYYEKKYGLMGLSTTTPLMQVKGFSLHSSGVNYLMPPLQGTRYREMRRMAQHRSIAETLFEIRQQDSQRRQGTAAGTAGGMGPSNDATGYRKVATVVEGTTAADGQEGDLAVPSWKGPKLVPELCSVHPLQLSLWRALQFIPSLMYRLEVQHCRVP